jgi:hypothetical protein
VSRVFRTVLCISSFFDVTVLCEYQWSRRPPPISRDGGLDVKRVDTGYLDRRCVLAIDKAVASRERLVGITSIL